MDIIIVILFSYLSGSIPFGLILTKIFGDQDIRNIGSGNIGATNVLRAGNKFLAALTLVLDILKGYIPIIIAHQYFPGLIQLSCLLAFLGHVFPVWLKFKGGKGVATYLGILLALSIQLGLLFMFTWLAVSLIKVTVKTVKDENIEDRDEYLNIRETTSHVNINKRPN